MEEHDILKIQRQNVSRFCPYRKHSEVVLLSRFLSDCSRGDGTSQAMFGLLWWVRWADEGCSGETLSNSSGDPVETSVPGIGVEAGDDLRKNPQERFVDSLKMG